MLILTPPVRGQAGAPGLMLYLIRHGSTLDGEGTDPPLSTDGRKSAELAGRLILGTGGGLELVLSSPLRRALEHAQIISQASGGRMETLQELEPEGDASAVISHLSSMVEQARVAAVGHLPLLRFLISGIACDSHPLRISLERGSVVCIDADASSGEFEGTLLWSLAPSMISRLVA